LYKKNQIKLYSGEILNHYIKYSFGEEGIDEVMMLLYEKILKL